MGGRNETCHFHSCVSRIPRVHKKKKNHPETQVRSTSYVSVYGGEVGGGDFLEKEPGGY